jgi:AcrR family transcriptional regulator
MSNLSVKFKSSRPLAPKPEAKSRPSPKILALPTKQARAERTRDRLVEAGSTLLAKGSLDDVSIAQIASAAGCSVGVFYFRFKDKDAYFQFLLDSVFEEIKASVRFKFAPAQALKRKPVDMMSQCIDHLVAIMRTHQGLVRAAQRQTLHNSEGWQPVRVMGRWLVDQYVLCLALSHNRVEDPSFQHNARTGLHIVMSTLVNAVLNRPPQLNLESSDLVFWLNQVATLCLSVKDAPLPASLNQYELEQI